MKKLSVGILGATGAVGQKLIALLAGHPWFTVTELAASERSAGKKYGEHINWKEPVPLANGIKKLKIKRVFDQLMPKILFSGLDSSVAGAVEKHYAKLGHIVISNSKNHRLDHDVPLVIPELNADHLKLIKLQQQKTAGFIVTNPNCVVMMLAIALFPIFKKFGLKNVFVTSMQAISGAGYPGFSAMDILGNVIPYIKDEEEKILPETTKIFGDYHNRKIKEANFKISAACNRVPVYDGHTLNVAFSTVKKANAKSIVSALQSLKRIKLPSSPDEIVKYFNEPDRPQPLLDLDLGKGMTVAVGRLRPCEVLDWKFTVLGHNTIRGAAGAAILNAEYLVANKMHLT